VYEGVVEMDFGREHMEAHGCGVYRQVRERHSTNTHCTTTH
jgi:hypothetical protein